MEGGVVGNAGFDEIVASYYKFCIFEAAGRNLHLKIYNVFIE